MFIIITVTKEKANAFSPWISCLEKDQLQFDRKHFSTTGFYTKYYGLYSVC